MAFEHGEAGLVLHKPNPQIKVLFGKGEAEGSPQPKYSKEKEHKRDNSTEKNSPVHLTSTCTFQNNCEEKQDKRATKREERAGWGDARRHSKPSKPTSSKKTKK